jgi:hypothetical protein
MESKNHGVRSSQGAYKEDDAKFISKTLKTATTQENKSKLDFYKIKVWSGGQVSILSRYLLVRFLGASYVYPKFQFSLKIKTGR